MNRCTLDWAVNKIAKKEEIQLMKFEGIMTLTTTSPHNKIPEWSSDEYTDD
jgi:hypothetical protein